MSDLKFRVRALVPIVRVSKDDTAVIVVPQGMTGFCHGVILEARQALLAVEWDFAAVQDAASAGMVIQGWDLRDIRPEQVEYAP